MPSGSRVPVLFIGHGSPMNAIETNDYTMAISAFARERLPRPRAILCVSAHWLTEGTWVTHMENPRTIHDFHGFPQELFGVRYPAPGDPRLAEEIHRRIRRPRIVLDDEMWGLDHGAWSVLRHMYPAADVPVLQMSVSITQPPSYHFEAGRALRELRDEGVLILASGNIVHNLRRLSWESAAAPFDWALEFDLWVKERLEARDFRALVEDATISEAGRLSIPTPDHWLPALYAMGAAAEGEPVEFIFEGVQNASISMRSFAFGADRFGRA